MAGPATLKQSVLDELDKAFDARQRKDWEGAVFHFSTVRTMLGALERQTPPCERYLRARADLEQARPEASFDILHRVAKIALEAGLPHEALGYVQREIGPLPGDLPANVAGSILHDAYQLKDAVHLALGDTAQASAALLDSVKRPPREGFFLGPNMALARDLLKRGVREPVIAYLVACEQLGWAEGQAQLASWKEMVEKGEMPNFAVNAKPY